MASRAGLELGYVAGLETGGDWMDRRSRLAALAGALHLDVSDLTGQPYPPRGAEHAAVRAVAFHLRRRVLQSDRGTSAGPLLDELAGRVRDAAQAEAEGDEHRLALALPELIDAADLAVTAATPPGRGETIRLRVQAHVLGAGLLRRLGYKDLAWVMLHRARPGTGEPLPVLVEEVHLLIDLGFPEYALARAERVQGTGAGQETGRHRSGPHACQAASAVELACWDLASRAAGVKVTALLGGTSRTTVPAYATALGFDPAHPAAPDAAAWITEAGFWGRSGRCPGSLSSPGRRLSRGRSARCRRRRHRRRRPSRRGLRHRR
ncbi:helix-turn-helix domain-containing protein [Streptomyces sp. NPDC001858]